MLYPFISFCYNCMYNELISLERRVTMRNKNLRMLIILAFIAAVNFGTEVFAEGMQASMSLDLVGGESEGFRGSTGDNKNYLEDLEYKLDENSLIYKGAGSSMSDGSTLTGSPEINWTITDGNDSVVSSESTGKASSNGNFTNPGVYKVHNSGARQISDIGGASGVAVANQSMGVTVHDATCPDLWVAIQDVVGDASNANTEEELENKLAQKILASAGGPFVVSKDDKELESTSYIFIDEGGAGERDKAPDAKTVRVTVAGSSFNEDGAPVINAGTLGTGVNNGGAKTRAANVSATDGGVFSGIYIRRNCPFICIAKSIDNGDKRASVGSIGSGISFTIKDSTGKAVEKDANGAYLFRVPNFPRSEYSDQPDYSLEVSASDVSGNVTRISSPIYVVNTGASIESNSNNQ